MDKLKQSQEREKVVMSKKELQQYVQEAVKTEMARLMPQLAVLLVNEMEARKEQRQKPPTGIEIMDAQIVEAISVLTGDERDHASTGKIAQKVGFASNWSFRPYLERAQERGVIVERRAKTGYWRVINPLVLQKAS